MPGGGAWPMPLPGMKRCVVRGALVGAAPAFGSSAAASLVEARSSIRRTPPEVVREVEELIRVDGALRRRRTPTGLVALMKPAWR